MRGMRTQARRIGIAAASALVLVLPLGPVQPAQAAPAADLSVTKHVVRYGASTLNVPADFDPARSATRARGHYEVTGTGLRLWTEAPPVPPVSPDPRKVAEYVATDTPLSDVGSPSLEWTQTSGAAPGYQLVTDLDGNGTKDAILVGEYGIWWGAEMTDPTLQAAAPKVPGPGNTVWQGPLAGWESAFPNAKVLAFGFSLGSGATGDGVLEAINFAGTRYTFAAGSWSSSVTAAPGSVLKYRLTVTNDSDADLQATGTTVTDTLPADLTYVPGSLKDNGNGCAFVGRTLTCNAGTFPVGFSTTITYRATLSNTITSDGLPKTIGHDVDVQKQEVFADLPAGQTRTYSVWCPSGYLPTDGGLLVDSVDQGGFYSDLVTLRSKPAAAGGLQGWTATVANFGDLRAQGKVKVTCLDATIGTATGHTHDVVVTTPAAGTQATAAPGATTDVACPAGAVPVAPWFDAGATVVALRASYATGNVWSFVFDYEPGAAFTYGVSCLASETTPAGGHTAALTLTRTSSTLTLGADARSEGVQQCGQLAHAITGGYEGTSPSVLSLGREQRGTNYMFRFYNDDWDQAWSAGIQVQCVGVRTPDERTFHTVTNTARVTTTAVDRSAADDSSSAVVKVDGAPVTPPGGVAVAGSGTRTTVNGNVRYVVLGLTCTEACSFTVKVLKNDVVVAKVVKSLPASPTQKVVSVPTTSAGRNLGAGQVTVKVKTDSGTNTKAVTLS